MLERNFFSLVQSVRVDSPGRPNRFHIAGWRDWAYLACRGGFNVPSKNLHSPLFLRLMNPPATLPGNPFLCCCPFCCDPFGTSHGGVCGFVVAVVVIYTRSPIRSTLRGLNSLYPTSGKPRWPTNTFQQWWLICLNTGFLRSSKRFTLCYCFFIFSFLLIRCRRESLQRTRRQSVSFWTSLNLKLIQKWTFLSK